MRWLAGLACLTIIGCSKAPDRNELGEATTSASQVAFAYRYDFRLPSARISDAQEAQAQACEQLTPARCRITGMTYRLDGSGQVNASLDVAVSAPAARAFGRRGVEAVEAAGGALTGAEITGTDTAPVTAAANTSIADADTDAEEIGNELDRSDLTANARTTLRDQRAEQRRIEREARAAQQAARASVSTTPISFTYAAGSGTGLRARLAEAAQAGYASLTFTLASLLTLIAYLGPPLVVLIFLGWLWHRFGRRWWTRAFPPLAHETAATPPPSRG